MSIQNLWYVNRNFLRYVKNQEVAKSHIRENEYYSKINRKTGLEKVDFEEDWEVYQQKRREGNALANKFFHILKYGKAQENIFTKTQRIQSEEKKKKNIPPKKEKMNEIEKIVKNNSFSSRLNQGKIEIQENLCNEEYSLPFLISDEYGNFLDLTLSIIEDVKKLSRSMLFIRLHLQKSWWRAQILLYHSMV